MSFGLSHSRAGNSFTPSGTSPLRYGSTTSPEPTAYSHRSRFATPSQSSWSASPHNENSPLNKTNHHGTPVDMIGKVQREVDAPGSVYRSARQSLRPLAQAPIGNDYTSPKSNTSVRERQSPHHGLNHTGYSPAAALRDSHSPSVPSRQEDHETQVQAHHVRENSESAVTVNGAHGAISSTDIGELKKSTTKHLRNLSRFTSEDSADDFSLAPTGPSVAGLMNRRQLKRTDSIRAPGRVSKQNPSGIQSEWNGRNWMDKQRQFLQAYEYLCHIGEAKEWIEDIIHKPIPPIVQLEEELRDGVTLAEIVQALKPEKQVRIFNHPKLQYRHSDNIAIFFRFLAEVDLPELFHFELIDLYEKKNIPKVIYCIHALSWLLYRNGMVGFRIGNLVGQLQFEQHELEEMQKGLDNAGVNMPSFSGMGASFGAEPEPETEEERIQRELGEEEARICEFQAQLKGCLTRLRLGDSMQSMWDAEDHIANLQARIRGDWARQIFGYRLDMKRFATNLQGAARGFLVRNQQKQRASDCRYLEADTVQVQSLIRAFRSRQETSHAKMTLRREVAGVTLLQGAIKGHLQRKANAQNVKTMQRSQQNIASVQALLRGFNQRRSQEAQAYHLRSNAKAFTTIQALARAHIARRQVEAEKHSLERSSVSVEALQSALRGLQQRGSLFSLRGRLNERAPQFVTIQASIRAAIARTEFSNKVNRLKSPRSDPTAFQAATQGFMARQHIGNTIRALELQSPQITKLQSAVRGFIHRNHIADRLDELHSYTPEITDIQALARAMLLRVDVGGLLDELEDMEEVYESLQAAVRGFIIRRRFAEKREFYRRNMEKVIKVQSFVRAKIQGEAYKSLTSGKNPPVGTVKNFVHLLNDSDFDFDEEVEFERLRKTVVQHVRQNELADQYITQLDIKIALLVKNKITLDEVVKHQKHFGGAVGRILPSSEISLKDPFDLKALNKNSRKKLEYYQELFFMLQTQPQYLARLFPRIREQATSEKDSERTKHLILSLFGYSQKRREEYHLLKLLGRSIKQEIDGCRSIQDFLRGNGFWMKVFGAYSKSARDRRYLRELFGPILKENVMENPELDLESDPMAIYLTAIENEQLRTGQMSHRRPDISREEAIRDRETKALFIVHLQDLRHITDQVLGALEAKTNKTPYGVRFIARQIFDHLKKRFPHEEEEHLIQIAGNWIWKSFLQPALIEPDKFGVIDKAATGDQKKNINEIGKVFGQISSARLFGQENVFLQPLNAYISQTMPRLKNIWLDLMDIPEAEAHFDTDEFNDLYAKTKPTLYIKLADIFAIHQLVAQEISSVCPSQDDALRSVIRELGSVKSNESELSGVSSAEISLTLSPKLHVTEDPDAEVKALFMETKRCTLYIIRVQSGTSLMEIMVKPITHEDEEKWRGIVQEELSATSRKRGAYSEANPLIDIASLSYSELKRTALENILLLEQHGRLSRHNHYQDLLNQIALDIRTKHKRRIQRARELDGVRQTLDRLNDQAGYLDQQLKTYNDYIEQAMVTLQNKKGKRRFLMPFSKQWNHERELQLSGRTPKFGSFKYSVNDLANRGILVTWNGYHERQWHQMDLTISSNEVGVFCIEGSSGSIGIPGATAQIPLDDLLEAQYNGTQFMEFFGGEKIKVNVNLFVHLIMRKFYKDKGS